MIHEVREKERRKSDRVCPSTWPPCLPYRTTRTLTDLRRASERGIRGKRRFHESMDEWMTEEKDETELQVESLLKRGENKKASSWGCRWNRASGTNRNTKRLQRLCKIKLLIDVVAVVILLKGFQGVLCLLSRKTVQYGGDSRDVETRLIRKNPIPLERSDDLKRELCTDRSSSITLNFCPVMISRTHRHDIVCEFGCSAHSNEMSPNILYKNVQQRSEYLLS